MLTQPCLQYVQELDDGWSATQMPIWSLGANYSKTFIRYLIYCMFGQTAFSITAFRLLLLPVLAVTNFEAFEGDHLNGMSADTDGRPSAAEPDCAQAQGPVQGEPNVVPCGDQPQPGPEKQAQSLPSPEPCASQVYATNGTLNPWLFDFICLLFGIASAITLIVLLRHYDQSPVRPWILGITLNGVIAVISFVWKSCMAVLIADSVGQLKWQWFQTKRKLIDMQRFDDASRGGFGGFQLVFHTPWAVAKLAGVIIVLSMAFDPFLQQLVSYPTETTRIRSDNITIRRGVRYTMLGESQSSLQAARQDGREDHYLAQNVQGAVLLSRYASSYQAIRGIFCPQNTNCSWDVFPTLGLCSKSAILTASDWETDCEEGTEDCSYNFPGMASFEIKTPGVEGYSSLLFEAKEVAHNASQQWFDIGNPILTTLSLRMQNGSSHLAPRNATLSTIYPCVRTIDSTYIQGQASVGVFDSWRNDTQVKTQIADGIPINLPDVYMTPVAGDLKLSPSNFTKQTYFIAGPVADLLRTTLRSTLLVRVWDGNQTYEQWNATYTGYGNSYIGAFTLAHVPSIEDVVDAIALSVTYYIRTLYENDSHRVIGYITKRTTIINVRWEWFTYPIGIFCIAIMIFIFAILRASSRVPVWKNSVFPLLFAFRECDEEYTKEWHEERDMKVKARNISTHLVIGRRGKHIDGKPGIGKGSSTSSVEESLEPKSGTKKRQTV